MSWFKVDDTWSRHPKVRAAGKDGRALWIVAGDEIAATDLDGVVKGTLLKDYAYFAEVNARKATQLLVAAGLWHDVDTIAGCGHCHGITLDAGDFYFHDWTDYQPLKSDKAAPISVLRRQRRDQLHRRHVRVKEQVVARDLGRCRYCGIEPDFRDRVGIHGGTYDHVDPAILDAPDFDLANDLSNVVVACRQCNGRKCDRTPLEAGMPLLPVGTTEQQAPIYIAAILAGASPEAAEQAMREQAPRRLHVTPPAPPTAAAARRRDRRP